MYELRTVGSLQRELDPTALHSSPEMLVKSESFASLSSTSTTSTTNSDGTSSLAEMAQGADPVSDAAVRKVDETSPVSKIYLAS